MYKDQAACQDMAAFISGRNGPPYGGLFYCVPVEKRDAAAQ